MALSESYLDKVHRIYADQLYSSIPLVESLLSRDTCYTDKRRQQLPSVVRERSFKLQKGETKAWRNDKKLVLAWRDKGKPTIMISTAHEGSVRTRRGNIREKPLVVDCYNQYMGGVDIADQMGCYYSFDRKSVKWWRKLLYWLLEVSVVNAYIGQQLIPEDHMLTSGESCLCEGFPSTAVRRSLFPPSRSEERLEGRHFIELGQTRRRCLVCNDVTRGQRHETKYYCTTCSTHPPLHV